MLDMSDLRVVRGPDDGTQNGPSAALRPRAAGRCSVEREYASFDGVARLETPKRRARREEGRAMAAQMCQRCGQRPAVATVRRTGPTGEVQEQSLCEVCLAELGLTGTGRF